MLINISDDLIRLQNMGLLGDLLLDRTTKRNIMWATDAYSERGPAYERNEEIRPALITGDNAGLIKTRARKAFEQQSERTRKRAEVFTPLWVIQKMNDYADEVWFGRKDGFQKADESGHIAFKSHRTWKHYVENRRMELTCGEAPFLTTRYDAETGELIPLSERIGLLDRKLRAVNENAAGPDEWLQWAYKALCASYGYEFQGDSLLIARVNVLMTFEENMEAVWRRKPTPAQYKKAIRIITWNLWQMDGLTDRIPYHTAEEQFSLFEADEKAQRPWCRIYNWRQQRNIQFRSMKGARTRMKFDYIIGNPPYQAETKDNNRQSPIYNYFMEEAYKTADVIELITPARFLFDAGQTPKAWNEKMLNDEHLKVLFFEPNGTIVFPNADIKGGIAITIRNRNREYGKIGVFTSYPVLNNILYRVGSLNAKALSDYAYPKSYYHFSEKLYEDFPKLKSRLTNGNEYIIDANIFAKMPEVFSMEHQRESICVHGREGNARVNQYIKACYIKSDSGIDKYKVFVTGANGTGRFGETLSTPFVGKPYEVATQTYMSFGFFESELESSNCLKYIKTKFARCLLSVLKVTQNNPRNTWSKIPLQDFTPASDIDWSKSIPEIDRQLYAKYGLDDAEITFIETHVKEMS